jgi:hypothetical protein
MSEADQFWQYAKEATLSACCAQNGQDKQSMLELARIWTQAAIQERVSMVNRDTVAEAIAA